MQSITKTIAPALLLLAASAAPAFAGTVQINDAVAHLETDAEHGDSLEIFMSITNSGGALDRLYAVRSKIAGEGRIAGGGSADDGHNEGHEDHLLATSVDLPAGATTTLSEEGSHLELGELKRTPEIGDEIKVTLFFEQAGRVKLTVTVEEEAH
jgi:copper(I)-binding protein